ncbi:MAG: DNRLRE domain-containing protein [Nocardioides sp.]
MATSLSLIPGAAPAVATESAPAIGQQAGVVEASRPDPVSAMVSAQALGERVEDSSQRTDSVRVFANPDGTWTSETASGPTSVLTDAGQWVDIDTKLVEADGMLTPVASPTDVEFSAGGTKVVARLSEAGRDLEWRWPTVLPEPVVSASDATYVGVAAGGAGDLVVTAIPGGFSHNIVLHEAPSTGTDLEVTLPVLTDGAELSATEDGGLSVDTATGRQLVAAPQPLMWDSSDTTAIESVESESEGSAGSDQAATESVVPSIDSGDTVLPVPVDVGENGAGTATYTLTVDADFLDDPDTVYPVVIDPTFTTYTNGDVWLQNTGLTTGQTGDAKLQVGTDDGGTHKSRAFVRFSAANTSKWAGVSITSAEMRLRNFNSASCTSAQIKVRRVAESWDGDTMTWANQPGVGGGNEPTFGTAFGGGSACPAGWATWDVTPMVQYWADGGANDGLRVAANDETNSNSFRRYRSANYSDASMRPNLVVTYNSYPTTASKPSVSPGNTGYSTDLQPTLKSTISDPDGAKVQAEFTVKNTAGTTVYTGTSSKVASGSVASVKVPAGKLSDGQTYTVTAKASDGTLSSKNASAARSFTVDTTDPSLTITATNHTDGGWVATAPSSNTFTFNGSSDTTLFRYTRGEESPKLLFANGAGDATLSWNPPEGAHRLTVTAIDAAGNETTKEFGFGVGTAPTFVTPNDRMRSNAVFPLSIQGPNGSTDPLKLEWRYATETTWNEIASQTNPSAPSLFTFDHLPWTGLQTTGGPLFGVATYSDTFDLLWDATKQEITPGSGNYITAPALLELRACYTSSCSDAQTVQLIDNPNAPSTSVGPLNVDLQTGEATLAGLDAVDSTAGIGRSFTSFDSSTTEDGPFGRGWTAAGLSVDSSFTEATIVDHRDLDGTIALATTDTTVLFEPRQTDASTHETVYARADATDDGSRLTLTSPTGATGDETLQWTAPYAGSVTWQKTAGVWGPPTSTSAGEDESTTSFTTNTAGNLTWISQVSDDSITCTALTQGLGCRGLNLSYDTNGHVTSIARSVYDPKPTSNGTPGGAGAGRINQTIATYTYDGNGRLTSVCDPRPATPLCVTYEYTVVATRTLLSGVTPAGELKWRFSYDTSGRLTAVKRALDPDTNTETGDATWTVVYDVPTSGPGLPDLSTGSTVEAWGQDANSVPDTATAVFNPAHVPGSTPNETDWPYAQLFYASADGTGTNTAVFGAGQWLVDTTWYDEHGNIVRTLDGAGRARALAGGVATDEAKELAKELAEEASSLTIYNSESIGDGENAITPGTRVEEEYGPAHTSSLKDGTTGLYRNHTAYTYDDELTVPDDTRPAIPDGQVNFGLVVSTTYDAVNADQSGSYDASVTRNLYGPVVAGDGDGWTLGTPSRVQTLLEDDTWSTETTRYDTNGNQIETRQPGGATDSTGAGSDAHSTWTNYYSVGNTDTDCDTSAAGTPWRADWAGLVCKQGPAGTLSPNLPTTYNAGYNVDLATTRVIETSGSTTRSTVVGYDTLGRSTSKSTAIAGEAAATVTSISAYDATSGVLTSQSDSNGTVTTTYDQWGRTKSYTDSTGMTSTATYTADGQIATTFDGTGTYTYTYDQETSAGEEHRRVPTTVDLGLTAGTPDTAVLSHAASGALDTVAYPNGMTAIYGYDEAGTTNSLVYTGTGGAELIGFSSANLVDGRTAAASSTASSQNYTYDNVGRLTTVNDNRYTDDELACTTRVYGFSAASERTSLTSYAADGDGACQTTAADSTRTSIYDAANRITNTGYSYDNLGRTLTIPAADTAATNGAEPTGNLGVTYYADDMVKTLTQDVDNGSGGSTTKEASYTLDSTGRIAAIVNKTDGTETTRVRYRFTGTGDSPTNIQTSEDGGNAWVNTRYLTLPGIGMIGSADASGAGLTLANLHGDTVATSPITTSAATITSYNETDENGNNATGRYNYLGTQQRSSDTIGGITLMGARLYNPVTGTFLSVDSVLGGGATRYSYPYDAVNMQDIDGRMWGWVYKGAMKLVGIGLTGVCAGSVTFFYVCRAVASGLVGSLTYLGWHIYVKHDYWTWTEAIATFIWSAIASLPGSGLVATSVVSSMKYWVGRILSWTASKFRAIGWAGIAGLMYSFRDRINSALSSRRYYA